MTGKVSERKRKAFIPSRKRKIERKRGGAPSRANLP